MSREPLPPRCKLNETHFCSIIFVHGLNAPGTKRLRRSLKTWLRLLNSPASVQEAGIHVFGFTAADLLSKGKERFNDLSKYLFKDVIRLGVRICFCTCSFY